MPGGVSDQGGHFMNDTIRILTKEFMILHRRSTTYYPQANGQAESTNKVFKTVLTKMVNANHTDWDTKLHTALWAYQTAYKVTTKHTPFSLVFGTEALLPIPYVKKMKRILYLMNYIRLWRNEWSNSEF